MAGPKDRRKRAIKQLDEISFAGDYNLNAVILQNHKGEGVEPESGGENLLPQMLELNIYEAIDKRAVTGEIVITDALNLIGNLPIQGTERIIFRISTPGTTEAKDMIDASELTGHPFYVYKISNRKQISEGVLLYTIHFGSREFMRSLRTRVSKAYSGTIDEMAREIFSDKLVLDSRKRLNYEPCKNVDKIVIPNLRPLDAIEMLARRALPKNSNGIGYYFYETTSGYHFRSWESMCVNKGKLPREPKATFQYKPMNMETPKDSPGASGPPGRNYVPTKIEEDMESVEAYEFLNTFHDVAANQAMGTYAHRVITHNLYNKNYNIDDYSYHENFGNIMHAETKDESDATTKFQVTDSPVDFDELSVSEYPNSKVSVLGSTRFLHNDDVGNYGTDSVNDGVFEAQRLSQEQQIVAGTRLRLTIKGHSFIEAGDLIQFNLLSVEPTNSNRFGFDPQYSGRYVVYALRHQIHDMEYKMVIECVKDSVTTEFGSTDKFPGEHWAANSQEQDIYDI